jgi:hypothetical protein
VFLLYLFLFVISLLAISSLLFKSVLLAVAAFCLAVASTRAFLALKHDSNERFWFEKYAGPAMLFGAAVPILIAWSIGDAPAKATLVVEAFVIIVFSVLTH